ncbi:uncharacterized protein si:dkey-111e8.4 isoform X2 [Osmerus eperlanus]|uniref:uncharacterized protein si:dkey-111e8.4 isoform X2 n=1 Tax=Osmerus eperlanus TaxID=29151 RepID=UPI002E148092
MDVTEVPPEREHRTSRPTCLVSCPLTKPLQETRCPQVNKGMSARGDSYGTLSQWLNSDVFIVFVVVLLLLLLVLAAMCWIFKRFRNQRAMERLQITEIEIVSGDGSGNCPHPRFTLKIKTDKNHANQMVQMLLGRGQPMEGSPCPSPPSTSAPSPAEGAENAASNIQGPQVGPLPTATPPPSTPPRPQPPERLVTNQTGEDEEDSDTGEEDQYYYSDQDGMPTMITSEQRKVTYLMSRVPKMSAWLMFS